MVKAVPPKSRTVKELSGLRTVPPPVLASPVVDVEVAITANSAVPEGLPMPVPPATFSSKQAVRAAQIKPAPIAARVRKFPLRMSVSLFLRHGKQLQVDLDDIFHSLLAIRHGQQIPPELLHPAFHFREHAPGYPQGYGPQVPLGGWEGLDGIGGQLEHG